MAVTMKVGSNSESLQRNLGRVTSQVGRVYERLASGMRINRASDDAAGLAVASNLTNNARLFSVAIRNVNDGVSALNIVDSALENQGGILTRLRELATQSANGSLSDTQRRTLDGEYQSLLSEFTRLANTTKFNGLDLFVGSQGNLGGSLTLQLGITGESLSALRSTLPSGRAFQGVIRLNSDIAQQNQLLGGDGEETADDTIVAVNLHFGQSGLTRSEIEGIYGNTLHSTTIVDSNGRVREVLTGIIGWSSSNAAAYTSYELAADGTYTFLGSSLNNNYTASTGRGTGALITTALTFSDGATATMQQDYRGLTFLNPLYHSDIVETAIGFSSIERISRARSALDILGQRLDGVTLARGEIGALQSRLASTLSVLASSRENSFAAAARITDIDVAGESAELTRLTILQNAGTALLAQQRSTAGLVLDLLRA